VTDFGFLTFLLITGFLVGGLGGTLGLGGGVIAAPVLLYVTPLVGLGTLPVSTVTGLTMVLSLFSTVSSGLAHRQFGTMHMPLVRRMGGTMLVATFIGALLGRWAPDWLLLTLLALLAALGALAFILVLGRSVRVQTPRDFVGWQPVAGGAAIGLLGGLVGQGGAFLVLPTLYHWIRQPMRVAVSTSIGVVFLSALGGVAGKILSSHAPLLPSAALALGGVFGGRLGATYSPQVPVRVLRLLLAVVLGATALRIGVDAWHRLPRQPALSAAPVSDAGIIAAAQWLPELSSGALRPRHDA